MTLLQINILPEISNILKYGFIGFGATLIILTFYLLRAEQRRSPRRSSILSGIYAFMVLGIILAFLGLAAPGSSSLQKSSIVLDGSKKNTVISSQSQGDSVIIQESLIDLNLSDSNNIQSMQKGGLDTIKKK